MMERKLPLASNIAKDIAGTAGGLFQNNPTLDICGIFRSWEKLESSLAMFVEKCLTALLLFYTLISSKQIHFTLYMPTCKLKIFINIGKDSNIFIYALHLCYCTTKVHSNNACYLSDRPLVMVKCHSGASCRFLVWKNSEGSWLNWTWGFSLLPGELEKNKKNYCIMHSFILFFVFKCICVFVPLSSSTFWWLHTWSLCAIYRKVFFIFMPNSCLWQRSVEKFFRLH